MAHGLAGPGHTNHLEPSPSGQFGMGDGIRPQVAGGSDEPMVPRRGGASAGDEVPPHGPTLAREFPLGIYLSVVGAYTWLLIAAWLFFGRSGWTDFELAFVSIILLILFGLPAIAIRVAWSRSEDKGKPWADFLFSTVDTATGPLSGGEAWLQILVIPLILALAATAIEIVDRLVT